MRKKCLSAWLTILLVLLCAGLLERAWGQQVTAVITGTVVDPTGAGVANANVTATDLDRGVPWATHTDESGVYVLPRIPIGQYNLKVQAQGFQIYVHNPFVLVLNQTARIDVTLKVGSVAEAIEVTGTAPLLQTDTTQLSTTIDTKMNETLPLATRNYVQLALLSPGAVTPNPQSFTRGQDMTDSGRPYINGNREQSNNFLLDGVDNNEVSDNEVGYTPSVDAIQEVNLIAQNPSAEYGDFQGGIISTSIKSGTNNFHGDVFEFFRNDVLNANTWANGLTVGNPYQPGVTLPNGVGEKPTLRWNMFGATLGGPILKHKLFFFVDYQGQRQDHPSTTEFYNVVTNAERKGDLSALCTKGFSSGLCNDPTQQIYNPFNVVGGQRQPFLNNQITPNLISPVVTNLFASKYYPAPTTSASVNNFASVQSNQYNNNQGDARIDYYMSDRDRFFGRWSQMSLYEPLQNSWAIADTGATAITEPVQSSVLNWTHMFTPSLMNEARVGFNYVKFWQSTSDNGVGDFAESLGIANGNANGPGLPHIVIGSNISDIGNNNIEQKFGDVAIQANDTLLITKGRHLMHTGFQFLRYRIDTSYSGNAGVWGEIDFGGQFSSALIGGTSTGGSSLADFLLGLPSQVQRGGVTGWGQRSSLFSGFFQDDWRITDALTLNLGLRYENHTPWIEANNHQVNFGLLSGAVEFAGQNGNSDALYNAYNLGGDFQPRIGFAWAPRALGRKTVIRGAYSLSSYSEGMGVNNRLAQNTPFVPGEAVSQYTSNGTNLPGTTLSQGLPLSPAPGAYTGITEYAGLQVRMWDPNFQPALVQQWNGSVQYQITPTTTFTAGYVGQHGTHLTDFMWANERYLNPNGTTSPGYFIGGNPTLKNEVGAVRGTFSNGASTYKAMQLVVNKRVSQGLEGQLSYTLSNCKTDAAGFYGAGWGGSMTTESSASPQNVYDVAGDWGNCYFDATHIVTGFVNYALPVGHGKQFGNDMNRIVNGVIGNWELSGILSYHTGFAMVLDDGWGVDPAGVNGYLERPDVTGAITYPKTKTSAGLEWFDPSAFTVAPTGHFGNEPVGDIRGPGLSTFDFGIHKYFPVTESKRFEFRAEAINLFNHPIYMFSPGQLFLSAGTGLGVINTSQGERNLQLAMKFYF
jgi:Carboxypeptidase regulatory-like domain